jgi:hypothetical protein
MSKFNTAVKTTKTTNLAGGSAYELKPEVELVTALLTSFLDDKYYESGSDRQKRLVKLVDKVDPYFAAQSAIYARTQFGMRSVSHLVAGELAKKVKGAEWTKRFFDEIVYRPDDMLEIFSYYRKLGKDEPHAMRKGFANALTRFDAYQLAKYRGAHKAVKLVDIVNMVHPNYTDAITALVNDELRNKDTWEAKVSEAGKSDKETAKSDAWKELVKSGKIGYFALLRNLRNIIDEAPESVLQATKLLTNKEVIKKSLVMPFRFLTAIEQIEQLSGKEAREVLIALNTALDISCDNVPKFDGDTLVCIDTSGSMYGGYGSMAAIKKASIFGVLLAKSNNADIMIFDDNAEYLTLNLSDSTLTLARQVEQREGGGTNMSLPFQQAKGKYDRIIVLTDMQSWLHDATGWGYSSQTPAKALDAYKARTGADPFVYCWDIAGYGTSQFPRQKVMELAGWSDKVFDIMKIAETDKEALVNTIKKVKI